MRKIIIFILIVCIILNFNMLAIASNSFEATNVGVSERIVDKLGNVNDILILNEKDCLIVRVLVNDELTQEAIIKQDGTITAELFDTNEILEYKLADFGIYDTKAFFEGLNDKHHSDYDYNASPPAGYEIVDIVRVDSYPRESYIYMLDQGFVGRTYEIVDLDFAAGAAVSVIVGVLYGILFGPITIGYILGVLGTSVVSGFITSAVWGRVDCIDYKRFYKALVADKEMLNTFTLDRYITTYNKFTRVEDRKLQQRNIDGFLGSTRDMGRIALENYYSY